MVPSRNLDRYRGILFLRFPRGCKYSCCCGYGNDFCWYTTKARLWGGNDDVRTTHGKEFSGEPFASLRVDDPVQRHDGDVVVSVCPIRLRGLPMTTGRRVGSGYYNMGNMTTKRRMSLWHQDFFLGNTTTRRILLCGCYRVYSTTTSSWEHDDDKEENKTARIDDTTTRMSLCLFFRNLFFVRDKESRVVLLTRRWRILLRSLCFRHHDSFW